MPKEEKVNSMAQIIINFKSLVGNCIGSSEIVDRVKVEEYRFSHGTQEVSSMLFLTNTIHSVSKPV